MQMSLRVRERYIRERIAANSVSLHVAVDRQDLAGDRLGGIGGKEDDESGNVLQVYQVLEQLVGHRLDLDLVERPAAASSRPWKTFWMRAPPTAPGNMAIARILRGRSIESVFMKTTRPHVIIE
jgi:hypothetical protein